MRSIKILTNCSTIIRNNPVERLKHFVPSILTRKRYIDPTHVINHCAHTDVPDPNFEFYRRTKLKDVNATTSASADERRGQAALATLAMGTTAMYFGKTVATQLISSMAPAADVLAVAQLEIKLDGITEGKTKVFKWRGKPVFVTHRAQEIIDQERQTQMSELRDPETDEQRAQRPEWLIVIGICTHLGCIPIPNAGEFKGGYYCPCHGSHYDGAARIRKGPAPTNLPIPPYEFIDDANILVG